MPAHKKEHRKSERQRSAEYRERKKAEAEEWERTGTRARFWQKNIDRDVAAGTLDLHALLEKQSRALDQIHWVRCGWDCPSTDTEFYVGFDEGVECLEQFVKDAGGAMKEDNFTSEGLRAFRPGWALWRDFWKEPDLVKELQQINLPTTLYATYGLITSISEVELRRLQLHRKNHGKHTQAEPDCWQCRAKETEAICLSLAE